MIAQRWVTGSLTTYCTLKVRGSKNPWTRGRAEDFCSAAGGISAKFFIHAVFTFKKAVWCWMSNMRCRAA